MSIRAWASKHRYRAATFVVAVVAGIVVPLIAIFHDSGGGTTNENVTINNNGTLNMIAPPFAAPGKVTAKTGPSSSTGGAATLSAGPVEYSFWPQRAGYHCTDTACMVAPAITLDSAINNPVVGDERPFFCGTVGGKPVQDRLDVKPSDVIVLRIYVNNDANPAYLTDRSADATGVIVRVLVPTGEQLWFNMVGFVHASNAVPSEINDPMLVVGRQKLRLLYVPGSARYLHVVGGHETETALDDSIVSSDGASLGDIRPGTPNSGYVTLSVKVTAA